MFGLNRNKFRVANKLINSLPLVAGTSLRGVSMEISA